jgi:hypothetical protein
MTKASAPSTRKTEDAADGISAFGSVGSALVEVAGDVSPAANAKLIETANKMRPTTSHERLRGANRAFDFRPLKRVLILFESFLPMFSNADTTRTNVNEIRGFVKSQAVRQAKIAGLTLFNPAKTAGRGFGRFASNKSLGD